MSDPSASASDSVRQRLGVRPPVATVKVRARDEDYRIVQVVGNLFVCSRANGGCCCGHEEKDRMPFDNSLWADEWARRRVGGTPLRAQLHLSFVGCLGPCAVGNNAMLLIFGRAIWLKDLNDPTLAARVFDYAETMLAAGHVLPPPESLRDHVYERFLPPPDGEYEQFGPSEPDAGGLERLDPVCLMDVDPATARWSAEHAGRTYYFCAPACKRQFLADPAAFASA